jgi:heat shock protein HslJ
MKITWLLMLLIMACRPSSKIGELVGVPSTRTLEDTRWILKELNGKSIEISQQKAIYVQFNSADQTVTGFGGCNSLSGSFSKNGATIQSELASTRMFCEGKMDDESAFLKILGQPGKYKVEKHMLLVETDKQQVAILHAEDKIAD